MTSLTSKALPPHYYFDPEVFLYEKEKIFKSNWLFAGTQSAVNQHNDFVTFDVLGYPILIQNIHDEIQAFINICSHRKCKIQLKERGNRPLVCPYHNWSYGIDGKLKGIPKNSTDFEIDTQKKRDLSLKKVYLERCGNFLFINLSKPKIGLRAYLGNFFEILEDLSFSFPEQVKTGSYNWSANWKLAIETVLEVYHVPGTHPDTFSKIADDSCEVLLEKCHNSGHSDLHLEPKKWWGFIRKKLKLPQHKVYTEYNHFFIYPNLAIGITNGTLLSVQTYLPDGVNSCTLTFSLSLTKKSQNTQSGKDTPKSLTALKKAAISNFCNFNHATLEEDREMAEACHKNLLFADTSGILGKCEERISHFHRSWRQDVL